MKRYVPYFLIFVLIAGLHGFGILSPLDNLLTDHRFRLTERPGTGDLVLVEIDAASLNQLDEWPWPRRYHGALLDRLMAAGAKRVAFDIDFSGRSREEDDALFAQAIERAKGRVVLPVFEQHATSAPDDPTTLVNQPIAALRKHALLASVTVYPEANGQVRQMALAENLGGTWYPTLPALLADETVRSEGRFLIDFGIDVRTIPRLTYADVLAGKFRADFLRGKTVIVGAVALELGEQISTPLNPVLSGPVLQALAYESIVQNRTLHRFVWIGIIVVTFLISMIAGPYIVALDWRYGAISVLSGIAVLHGVGYAVQATVPIAVETGPWMLTLAAAYGYGLLTQVERFSRSAFRRRMEAEDQRVIVFTAVEDAVDGIIVLGWDDRVRLINKSASELIGVEVEDAVTRPIDELLRPLNFGASWFQGEPTTEFIGRLADTGEPVEFTGSNLRGSRRTVEMIARRSELKRSGDRFERRKTDRNFFSITLRDITELRAAERSQRHAAEAAVEANEAKSLFLANMSHELRTPLNAILGFTEMMRKGVLGPVRPAKYQEYVEDIHTSGRHLLSMLGDILDLSKVESGRQEIEARIVGIRELFTECLTIIEGRVAHLDRLITVDIDAAAGYIWADRRLLLQSILNLVSNSIKYSDPGTQIWLRSYVDDDRMVTIEIEDMGWGISEEDMKSVKQPFFQAKSDRRPGEGLGLGLSLVTKYAELHGGRFEIKSQVGLGTTARIMLPYMIIEGGKSNTAGKI